ncbi:MAG: hypothetical protein M3Q33_07140 [Acidobacteriota bacterium]|nr:hypothetical protein [Acidobacteriota bacterium]
MANQRKENKLASQQTNLSVKQMPTQSAEQVEISYSENVPCDKEERQIHPRRKAPKTPIGKSVEDETPSDSIKLGY